MSENKQGNLSSHFINQHSPSLSIEWINQTDQRNTTADDLYFSNELYKIQSLEEFYWLEQRICWKVWTHLRIESEDCSGVDQSQGHSEGCCIISALCIPEYTDKSLIT